MNLNDLQKQLENDVKQAAITSRINKNNKNIQNKNESENDYARAIMVTSIKYFTESLQKFCEQSNKGQAGVKACLLYTSPSPRDRTRSRMPSSA